MISEQDIEEEGLEYLRELGYQTIHGIDISPDGDFSERDRYSDVILKIRLKNAVAELNPQLPDSACDEAIKEFFKTESQILVEINKRFHRLIVEGIPVQYVENDGNMRWVNVKIIDFENPEKNDFLIVNQFTVIEDNHNRRPDTVLFVNGLPLAVIEYKNPADEKATLETARSQLETYKNEIPSLFYYNAFLIISDGMEARAGTITSPRQWFLPWKTIEEKAIATKSRPQLEVLLKGMCNRKTLLELVRHFVLFENGGGKLSKKIAAYHQYHAVNRAIERTVQAVSPRGDKRIGVVWHTQGAGKSLSMVFYTARLAIEPALKNPTIIVLTDRNELDDQLFDTFGRCKEILRQTPEQAKSRNDLKKKLKDRAAGGIIFTTIHKFLPKKKGAKSTSLSDRRNIIFIADEAHRSQYDFIDGFARHVRDSLPNASFVGFTGTPIELEDRNTVNVFGDYIHTYDIYRAVEDGATVTILYTNRTAKLGFTVDYPKIDEAFDYVTEREEVEKKEKLKSKWSRLEAVVGTDDRIKNLAKDIVDHFDFRHNEIGGKALIVGMSRRICVKLHDEIIKIKPDWYHEDDDKGLIKVVMTGTASETEWQEHIRNKRRRQAIADRMRDAHDPLRLAIVRDMWLTGFNAPALHTIYIDKPMRGHTLTQAIARVNRVYSGKDAGLVVDYIGMGPDLRKALAEQTTRKPRDREHEQEQAAQVMIEKYEVVQAHFHGFNYTPFYSASATQKMILTGNAIEHILQQTDGKERFLKHSLELVKAYNLAIPLDEALKIRDFVGFVKLLRAQIIKNFITEGGRTKAELDAAINQIVSRAIATEEIIDIFASVGLKKPDISILSPEFLEDVKNLPQKNVAVELLRKILDGEIKAHYRKNFTQGKAFSQKLRETIGRYHNRSVETMEVIQELMKIAEEIKKAKHRGEELGLIEEELAFYDALGTNDSAVRVLGDEVLKKIAQELTEMIRRNVTIDWTLRENIRAKLRVMVKRILRKYGYPPDKQKKATETVLEQATLLCVDWAQNSPILQ